MFFISSKLFWLFAAPANLMLIVAALGALLMFTRHKRLGRVLAVSGIAGLLVFGATPFSRSIMRVLEDRFPIANADLGRVDGIIVLGGAVGAMRGQVRFTDAASRMTEAVALARRYPNARLVFSGGDGSLIRRGGDTEATWAHVLFRDLGVADERLVLEDKSRNTRENATFSKALIAPKPGERWLLVTSAYHMPRSVACFRAAGFPVIPYPVDFHSRGRLGDFLVPHGFFSEGLRLGDLAIKEWVGLVAYRLAGYTDELLPKADDR
jgi:uncharacterized SAM-binding protein YcdF (DUF218 family)